MNITFPNISPQTMKKYPLYVLIAFLSSLAGYFMNNSNNSQKETVAFYKNDALNAKKARDSVEKELSNLKDALLIQNGIIQDYRKVVTKTDSIAKNNIKKPATYIIKLKK